MAKSGGSRGRPGRPKSSKPKPKQPPRHNPPPSAEARIPPTTFRLGAIPGATPGGWIDAWNERMQHVELILRPITVASQRESLTDGLDAALVRLPIDTEGLSVIPLYEEIAVVVTSADSHLTAVDELVLADLAREVLVVPRDDVLGLSVPGALAASFDPPDDTEQAIAIVASGVGAVVVPMSLARLHRRKDAAYRPLTDGPTSTVALAWVADRTTPEVEAFVGIVRGRTPNSSRG